MSHYTRHRTGARRDADLTIGRYVPKGIRGENVPGRIGFRNALHDSYARYARRRGWTVRSDPRGFVKVFDPRTGNVSFALRSTKAIWGLSEGLRLIEEISHALIRMMIEKRRGE